MIIIKSPIYNVILFSSLVLISINKIIIIVLD